MIRRVIESTDLVIDWHGRARQYMTVRQWGTHRLLMDTYTGYLSARLTDDQTALLEWYYEAHRPTHAGTV